MRRIAEEDLIAVRIGPFDAQTTGDIAADAGRRPLHDHQPDRHAGGEGDQTTARCIGGGGRKAERRA